MKPIASLGPDLPVELLAATGRYAGPLSYDADRPTPRAEQWLESKFAPWAFQILENWAADGLDDLEAVVFSRADDSAQRLYYYVCELRRTGVLAGPEPIILDVAHIPRATSVERNIAALRRLAERLGVEETALEAAMVGGEVPPSLPPGPVCLMAGTLPPDRRLHEAIEAQGWAPAGRTLPESWAARTSPVEAESGDAFERLGQRIHVARGGPRAFEDRAAALRARIAQEHARAAVVWLCEHDEAEAWHAPALRRVLDAEAIPHLMLVRRDWRATDGAVEEVAVFLSELRS